MSWKGEQHRHALSARGIHTAKGSVRDWEEAGMTFYESDEVVFDKRMKMYREKILDAFEEGNITRATEIEKTMHREAESMYGPFDDEFYNDFYYKDWVLHLADEYKRNRGTPFKHKPKLNLPLMPWVKPTIKTAHGTAYYVGTEVEDRFGHWNDTYYYGAGEAVIHKGPLHHIYVTNKYRAGVE